MQFRHWLEMSYQESDIPQYFYLACHLNHQLVSGALYDLKGITEKPGVAAIFWKQCFLEMPAKPLLEINKLSKVNYGNADYMVSNNFTNLNRVSDSGNLVGHKFKLAYFLKTVHDLTLPSAQKSIISDQLNIVIKNANIKNLGDFIKKLYWFLNYKSLKLQPNSETANYLKGYFNNLGGWNNEAEWIVKPRYEKIEDQVRKLPVLRVPQDSLCLIHPHIEFYIKPEMHPTPKLFRTFKTKERGDRTVQQLLPQLAARMKVFVIDENLPELISAAEVTSLLQQAKAGNLKQVTPELAVT